MHQNRLLLELDASVRCTTKFVMTSHRTIPQNFQKPVPHRSSTNQNQLISHQLATTGARTKRCVDPSRSYHDSNLLKEWRHRYFMKPVYPMIYDRLYFYYDYSSKQSFQSLSKQAACFIDKSRIPYTVIRSSPRFEIVLRNTYSQRKVRGGPNFCPPYIFSKWTKYGIWTKAFWSKPFSPKVLYRTKSST